MFDLLVKHLEKQEFIVVLGEGEADKKVIIDEK